MSKLLLADSAQKKPSFLSLDKIQYLIDIGRIKNCQFITPDILYDAGITRLNHGLIITGSSSTFKTENIAIIASLFDDNSIKQIENYGGFPISVYLNINGWRKLTRPQVFKSIDNSFLQHPPPTWKERVFYSNYQNRAYLNTQYRDSLPLKISEYLKENFYLIPEEKPKTEIELIRDSNTI